MEDAYQTNSGVLEEATSAYYCRRKVRTKDGKLHRDCILDRRPYLFCVTSAATEQRTWTFVSPSDLSVHRSPSNVLARPKINLQGAVELEWRAELDATSQSVSRSKFKYGNPSVFTDHAARAEGVAFAKSIQHSCSNTFGIVSSQKISKRLVMPGEVLGSQTVVSYFL